MRKAKVAALIIGGVSTCIFGGAFSIYATAPTVSSVTPNNAADDAYEVKSEELANVAAVTSIRTTPQTTTSKNNFSYTLRTTAVSSSVSTTATVTAYTMSFTTTAIPFEESFSVTTTAPEIDLSEEPSDNGYDYDVQYDYQYEYANEYVDMVAPNEYTEETEPATEEATEAPTAERTVEVPSEEAVQEETTEAVQYDVPEYGLEGDEETEDETEEAEAASEEQTEEAESEEITEEISSNPSPLSDEDYILLCNAVAHEAGCYWISLEEKAYVVEVIMNRVNDPNFPNSIMGVLSQPNQFTGSASYLYLGKFSMHVNDDVEAAVALYFNDPESFSEGYIGFYGDGYRNYFY